MSDFDSDEFIKGYKDCEQGRPEKPDPSSSYVRGYCTRYTEEQNMDHYSEVWNGR